MNRIEERFARLKRDGKKGFIVYIGAGDPNLDATRKLALAFDKAGVDVLELGVPFSDPLADGLVNQLAAQRGLESGTTPPKLLETIAAIRKQSQIPIVLYIYFNLIHRVGLEQFIKDAARAGVDGLLVLDLPPEESDNYEALMKKSGLCHIYLVAPTTPEDRMALIVKRGSGFIYYISREGVTGMQTSVATNLASQVAKIRAHTKLPVAVGFGVSNPAQAKLVAQSADAVIVGSAVVNQIAENGKSKNLVKRVGKFVKSLADAVKSMDAKHNHHFLPKLLLKGFVIKKDKPFIWVYQRGQPYNPGGNRYNHREKLTNNPYLDTIKNAGAEMDFYSDSNEDGIKDSETTENKLMLLEQQHDRILDKLRACKTITDEEKEHFSSYIVLMLRRVPAGRELSKKLITTKGLYEPTKELFQKLNWPDTPETRAYIKQHVESKAEHENYQISGHNKITLDSPNSRMIEELKKMVWTFYVAREPYVFLTSDNPVFFPDTIGIAGNKNLSELSFPISTNVALVASWNKTQKEGFVEATPHIVKDINRRTISKTSRYVYFSKNADWVVNLLGSNLYEYHPII
jgi:tryptophan synthase alpha chain